MGNLPYFAAANQFMTLNLTGERHHTTYQRNCFGLRNHDGVETMLVASLMAVAVRAWSDPECSAAYQRQQRPASFYGLLWNGRNDSVAPQAARSGRPSTAANDQHLSGLRMGLRQVRIAATP